MEDGSLENVIEVVWLPEYKIDMFPDQMHPFWLKNIALCII